MTTHHRLDRFTIAPPLGRPFCTRLVTRERANVSPHTSESPADSVSPQTLVEFKTSQTRWAVPDRPDNIQRTAWRHAYALRFGRPPTVPRLVTLVRTKHPAIQTPTTRRDERAHERVFHRGKEGRTDIPPGLFRSNRGGCLCQVCEDEQDCRAWTGNADRPEHGR
jgi:hypothetical protein